MEKPRIAGLFHVREREELGRGTAGATHRTIRGLVQRGKVRSMTHLRLAQIAAMLACVATLAACANTVRGVGKDVKGTVAAIEDTVN